MANENKFTAVEFDTGTDIITAIQFVIELAERAQTNYEIVYNKWFKMIVTPTTKLQDELNLFFSKANSNASNARIRPMKANNSIYRNKMLGWCK